MNSFNKLKDVAETSVMLFLDAAALVAIFKFSVLLRVVALPALYAGFPREMPHGDLGRAGWIFLIWIFFLYYEGLYTKTFSFWDEIKALCKVAFFSTVGVFTIVSVARMSADISRTIVVLMGLSAVFLLPAARIAVKKILRAMGLLNRRVLILGAGDTGRLVAGALIREPNYGYRVVGFLDDDPAKAGERINGVKVHGGVDRAEQYVKRCSISDLFIAMPGAGRDRVQSLVNSLQHKVDRILVVPDMGGIAVLGTGLRHFFHEEVLAFEIENNLANPFNVAIKRLFDIVVSLLLLPFLAVPMAVIVILILIDSKGAAVFAQERVGRRGRSFKCLKFRTMYIDAEERLRGLLLADPRARSEWEQNWKLNVDPRVTAVGRFLRTTSLDELPQVFNVLKGDMSLVGPRPVTKEEIDRYYRDAAELCFCVRPGITGLWQVSGRSNTGYAYRIALDSWYVRNWNLWLDIVILMKTFRIVAEREGAY